MSLGVSDAGKSPQANFPGTGSDGAIDPNTAKEPSDDKLLVDSVENASSSAPLCPPKLRPKNKLFSPDSPFGIMARKDPEFYEKLCRRRSKETLVQNLDAFTGEHTPSSPSSKSTPMNAQGAPDAGGPEKGEIAVDLVPEGSYASNLPEIAAVRRSLRRAFERADYRWNDASLARVNFSNIDQRNLVVRVGALVLRVSYEVIQLKVKLDRMLEEADQRAGPDDPLFPDLLAAAWLPPPSMGAEEPSLSGLAGIGGSGFEELSHPPSPHSVGDSGGPPHLNGRLETVPSDSLVSPSLGAAAEEAPTDPSLNGLTPEPTSPAPEAATQSDSPLASPTFPSDPLAA